MTTIRMQLEKLIEENAATYTDPNILTKETREILNTEYLSWTHGAHFLLEDFCRMYEALDDLHIASWESWPDRPCVVSAGEVLNDVRKRLEWLEWRIIR